MKLNINDLRKEMHNLNSWEELTELQGKITSQSPSQSGLNFEEANALLKEVNEKKRAIRWG